MLLCADIVSRSDHEGLKEPIDMISKSSELRGLMRYFC